MRGFASSSSASSRAGCLRACAGLTASGGKHGGCSQATLDDTIVWLSADNCCTQQTEDALILWDRKDGGLAAIFSVCEDTDLNAFHRLCRAIEEKDCPEVFGDQLERVVAWTSGPDLSALAGKPIRLRFTLKDADLYSLRFR